MTSAGKRFREALKQAINELNINNGITIKEATKGQREFFKTLNVTTIPVPNAYVYKDSYCLNVATKNGHANDTFVCIDWVFWAYV